MFADGVSKGSEYRFPPALELATADHSGALHHGNDDSTSYIVPLADMGNRHVDMEDDGGLDTARREQGPAERI